MGEKAYDIVALGEILIDFTPHPQEDGALYFRRNPGGAPLNLLAQASNLGAKCAFLGKVGRDGFGDFLEQVAREVGVDTGGLRRDEKVPTTLAFVHLAENGERSFSFYRKPGADIMLEERELDVERIQSARIFHFGSLSATDEPARSATRKAVALARGAGCIVSYDPNFRPALWERKEDAIEQMREQIAHAHVVKVSEEEMEMLTGEADPERGSAAIADGGASLVCVTYGAEGSYYRCGSLFGKAESFPVKAVDTTGAGDAFWGTVLSLLKDKTLEEIRTLSEKELQHIVRCGNAAGALAASAYGAINSMRGMQEILALAEGTRHD